MLSGYSIPVRLASAGRALNADASIGIPTCIATSGLPEQIIALVVHSTCNILRRNLKLSQDVIPLFLFNTKKSLR